MVMLKHIIILSKIIFIFFSINIVFGQQEDCSIVASSVITSESCDIVIDEQLLTNPDLHRVENTAFINPNTNYILLNSDMKHHPPSNEFFIPSSYLNLEQGEFIWNLVIGVSNNLTYADPCVAIDNNGREFYIMIDEGNIYRTSFYDGSWDPEAPESMTISIYGENTSEEEPIPGPNPWIEFIHSYDKPHLWIDNVSDGIFNGNVYVAYTHFYSNVEKSYNSEIVFNKIYTSSSVCNGWCGLGGDCAGCLKISDNINQYTYHHGANIQVGSNGNVYIVFALGDIMYSTEGTYATYEKALGFAKSEGGGDSFGGASIIINNIHGINSEPDNEWVNKGFRVNSLPVMAVDVSDGNMGPNSGNIYVVWADLATYDEPDDGVNILLIKSEDEGETWSNPICVNTDGPESGSVQFMPWITCDPVTGNLHVIFYDDRQVGEDELEVWCANSFDGGDTWEDFRISDIEFVPKPLGPTGSCAYSHWMGDYINITSHDGWVYPIWSDTRDLEGPYDGQIRSYCSPYDVGCQFEIILEEQTIDDGEVLTKKAVNLISVSTSSEGLVVEQNGELNLQCENEILISSTFHAKKGSLFVGKIDECTNSIDSKGTISYDDKMINMFNKSGKQKSNQRDKGYKIFPNPTNGTVYFESINYNKFSIQLFNSTGNKLLELFSSDSQTTIDLSNYPKGIYFVNFITDSKIFSEKVIYK